MLILPAVFFFSIHENLQKSSFVLENGEASSVGVTGHIFERNVSLIIIVMHWIKFCCDTVG